MSKPHKIILLLDIDGVINHAERFSSRYARDYAISPSIMDAFFTHVFDKCTMGKADLKEELSKVLEEWRWKSSTEDLLRYWLEGEVNLDTRILKKIQSLRGRGVQVYAATDQEKYRSSYILDVIGVRTYFDGAFISCDLGTRKSNPLFFKKVLENTRREPSEVIYWDDDPLNVKVAKEAGIRAFLYTSYDDFKRVLENYMS